LLRGFARLEFDVEDAEVIARALKPDDLGWARCYSAEGKLVVEVETEKIGAMLVAIDDYFLNVKAAVSALRVLRQETV
jgi:tRNA threonylcarbamoyladenosine modification (KEOPS) complex  Pcc1 subunit